MRIRDRDRLQHLTGCHGEPLKVRECERKTHMEREREVMLKETCIVSRWFKKKADWLIEKDWNVYGLFRKDSVGVKGAQMGEYTRIVHTHTHREAPASHTVQRTSFTTRVFFGESLSCLPPTSVIFLYLFPAAPFPPFPYLKATFSWNKTYKYQITYISSCICQRLLKSKPAHCYCLL